MMHSNRRWFVSEVASAEELAYKLCKTTWCCCNAFQVKGHPEYVWLNDATSEDGAQEYAIIKLSTSTGKMLQIESITFSWCDSERALRYVKDTLAGKDDNHDFACAVEPILQTPQEHGRCQHCA